MNSISNSLTNDLSALGGLLRCTTCGHEQPLNKPAIAQYMQTGWPEHCGYTMTWVTQRLLNQEVAEKATGVKPDYPDNWNPPAIHDTAAALMAIANEPHVKAALQRLDATETAKVAELEAHWLEQGDILDSIDNIVSDLKDGNTAALDEAIEVLQVMAARERRWRTVGGALEGVLLCFEFMENRWKEQQVGLRQTNVTYVWERKDKLGAALLVARDALKEMHEK